MFGTARARAGLIQYYGHFEGRSFEPAGRPAHRRRGDRRDQPYFGRRVAELGAGPPPLRRRDLTVDRLATLMTALTGPDRSFRSYAGEIAAGRGAAIAADHIVAYLRRTTALE